MTVEKEWAGVHNLVPHDHPSWAGGTIRDKSVTHLRVVHLEKFGVLSVGLLGASPVKDARANTKNEPFVGMLVHHMRGLDGGSMWHVAQLQEKVDPSAVLCLDGHLIGQVVLSIDIVKDGVIPVCHHIIQCVSRCSPGVRRAIAAESQVNQLIGVPGDSDRRIGLHGLLVQCLDRGESISATIIHIRLGGMNIVRALVTHSRKTRNDLVALSIGNTDGIILVGLVKLDHSRITLSVEDGDALSQLWLNIATVDLVDIHWVLIDGKH